MSLLARPRVPIAPGFLTAPVFSAPIVIDAAAITANGSNIFEGNWEQQLWADNPGANAQGAAIVIKTTQPVVIRNSRLRARRYCIHWDVSTIDLTVENCVLECRNPMQANEASGPAMNIVGPKNLVVEHCTFIGGGGIQLAETPAGGAFVRIRYNRALNIDGRMSDGAGSYVFERSNSTAYFKSRQFLQLRGNIVVDDGEVAWNEVVNDPFISRREDAFNIFGGSGVPAKPFWIHDNCIKGGASPRPYDNGYSGSGFVVEDARSIVTDTSVAQYVDIDDNQVIGATNVGLGFVGTGVSHVRARRNRFVSCGRINGRPVPAVSMNSPVNIYEDKGSTGPTYAVLEDNGYSWRRDATGEQLNGPWFPVIGNTGNSNTGGYVIAATTDEATEVAEWALWRAKVAAAGVRLGSTLAV
jgi:hypothetical protein